MGIRNFDRLGFSHIEIIQKLSLQIALISVDFSTLSANKALPAINKKSPAENLPEISPD